MHTFLRCIVRGALPAALAALVALAACGGQPSVPSEDVASFLRLENAQHVRRLVDTYRGQELELAKRGDRFFLRAQAQMARELRPGLERLLDRLALNDDEPPTKPAAGRPEERRDFYRRVAQNVLEQQLHEQLHMSGIEFLSARVTLSMMCVDGVREGLYQHVGAKVLLAKGSRDIDDCKRLAQESLDAGIKTVAGAAEVDVDTFDVRDYLRAPAAQQELALPAVPPTAEPAAVANAASVSPEPTPTPCPAAATTCPPPSGDRQATASPTVAGSEPTVMPVTAAPVAEPTANAATAADDADDDAVDAPIEATPAANTAPTEGPAAEPAPTARGAIWALYFVAIASLCGNVAFVLHWWRARRRENERARLARLFAKVA